MRTRPRAMTPSIAACRARRAASLVLGGVIASAGLVGCESTPATSRRPDTRVNDSFEGFARDKAQRMLDAHRLALRAQATEDPVEAELLWRRAIRQFRQNPAFWHNLGTVLADQNRYLEALEAFSTAADLDPRDARPLYNAGLLWFRRNHFDRSLELFEEALVRQPNYLPAMRGVMESSNRLRSYTPELLELLDQATILETDPMWLEEFKEMRLAVQEALTDRRETRRRER